MVSPFATPAEFVQSAFDHVMRNVRGFEAHRLALLRATYIRAHQAGDPRAERRAFQEAGASTLVEWPEFKVWLTRFRHEGRFPYLWRDIEKICQEAASEGVSPSSSELQPPMLELMAHAVAMTAYKVRDHSIYRKHMEKTGWRLSGVNDPVEDAIAAEHMPRVRLDDWRTWPPFFPGDRTSIQQDWPPRKSSAP